MATKKKETLLNCSVVAHILDVSPDDVMDLARKRELPSEKQGQHWKFLFFLEMKAIVLCLYLV
jgi:hypothetical protein